MVMHCCYAAFEEWAIEESWAELALPSSREAQEYFREFRSSATPLSEQTSSSADSSVVQGMIEELHMILKSARFSATVLVRLRSIPRSKSL